MNHQVIPRTGRVFGYLVASVVNLIGWVIVNNLLNWNVPFVTDRLIECLWRSTCPLPSAWSAR